jgi:hypothetical protein
VQKKNLVFRAVDYQLIVGHLYKMGENRILQRYVLEHERPRVVEKSHEGIEGRHYAENRSISKGDRESPRVSHTYHSTRGKGAKEAGGNRVATGYRETGQHII